MTTRAPNSGELCKCGRAAVIVYLTQQFGAVPYCGLPDGAGCVDRKRAPGAGRKPRDPGGALATVGTTVRLTPADFARVQAAAQAAGLTVAAYMASAIRSAARPS